MPPEGALSAAVRHAEALFDSGAFFDTLARRVACRTESQNPERAAELHAYLADELQPAFEAQGFAVALHANPEPGAPPLLSAERLEDPALPTVLFYGHGDVVRGHEGQWAEGRDPWTLTADASASGARWYGRGAADNKAQHSINLAALDAVRQARGGRLGFNAKWLVEMGEETGSPGLAAFCRAERARLASDVLIASDGPRLRADRPTVFLGSRGVANVDLTLTLREGGHHSGNWGGLLRNPGTVLANAIACLVDGRGVIRVQGLRPPPIPANVRATLADIAVGGGPGDPGVDAAWGEPGLSPAERVFGWNTLEVLAFGCGNPAAPVNAIPPSARATLQLRFVVGTDAARLREHLLAHLAAHGFGDIAVSHPVVMGATRLDPDNAWVRLALSTLAQATGRAPALLPNLGGSLPNDVFADILGLPTVWIPHSYPACSQHAPNEHVLPAVLREGLAMTTALLWQVGEQAAVLPRRLSR
ncbi:M20 family metallopeptidase [Aquabacterium sp. OR-4]|uniref:M20 family metallopeptidase n=1 Tax=Aquabacterium sp. OR-4 TaxID=2978127 RepID=UPI0021B2BDDB|nr:M20 family metallopeptidase [Aquabacterium sp. OR-4]MDT7837713.1 M20 family metallopeptidase [Aquabacterium sp. OR-4]